MSRGPSEILGSSDVIFISTNSAFRGQPVLAKMIVSALSPRTPDGNTLVTVTVKGGQSGASREVRVLRASGKSAIYKMIAMATDIYDLRV